MSGHVAMSGGWSSPVGRLLSRVGLGVLTCFIPPALVDDVLTITDRGEQRFRALPSRLGVYVVLGLCLLRTKPAPAVLRAMIPIGTLSRLREQGWRVVSSTALSKLRDRIGAVPFELLFQALTRPTPTRVRPWSHAFGLQVVAWDGTEITLADTDANRAYFPRHHGRKKTPTPGGEVNTSEVGVPKARLLVLLACGTRQLIGAVIGTLAEGEVTLARRLVGRLRTGMLLLADRNFLGYSLWTATRQQGTHLLWRAKQHTPQLPVQHVLPEGSWLSTLYDPVELHRWRWNVRRNRKRGHKPPKPRPINGITVRVVEALITVTVNGTTRTEHYRLVTSLLDPHTAPADQLIALYARRWAAETGIRDIKTVLLTKQPLRATTPIRALQELWATLTVYQALRLLICHTALTADLDPSQISFTAARDTAEAAITTTPHQATTHLHHACHDLSQQLITRHISYRTFPRALKNTLSRYTYRGKTPPPSGNAHIHIHTPPTTTHTPAQPRAA